MKPATASDWLDRTRRHMAAGSTDMADQVTRIDTARYVDPVRLAAEESTLFRRYPVAVSFASKLAKPGDYVTHDLLDLPLLLTRDQGGRLNAFLNVCRHRGAKLVWERGGCGRRALVCPYHAWTYDMAGALRGIPHEDGFAGVDRATRGLVRLPVAEAFGLVFVVPSPGEAYDFDGFLGGIRDDLDSFGLGDHVLYDEREIGVAANWKVVVEGGLETYHVRHAHRTTIAPMFTDNVIVADRLDPHMRLFFTKQVAQDLTRSDGTRLSVRDYGNLLYFIFPNLLILVQPDHATAMIVLPDGTDACRIHGGALIPQPAETPKARAHWDRNVKIFWDALDEDFQMAQAIQRGFRSGANSHLTFGRFEQGCGWFHDSMDRALAAEPSA
ncbi:aromatic ring-hydroxylating oxygenase subunit alpha [Ferrovibrio xuzhouensis]|uniref:Aromatic ring-hydroxylating dioxygenase subunit alpha n=1 Tax=Ferrovibrio xuzhouensis TaxID=1576914 RepID=A0ABV7VL71_9PROT